MSKLFDAVYPSLALLAGMDLDLFKLLKERPRTAEQLAENLEVQIGKLKPLLYAFVVAGLLMVEEDLFRNTAEAGHHLVRDESAYLGEVQRLMANNWLRSLKIAQAIRAGVPVDENDYHSMSQ